MEDMQIAIFFYKFLLLWGWNSSEAAEKGSHGRFKISFDSHIHEFKLIKVGKQLPKANEKSPVL